MAKKRTEKPVPEHLKRIDPTPTTEEVGLLEAAKASAAWHNATIRKRRLWLKIWEAEYASGGNPLAVWDAYLTVREMKWEIPEWILKYFDSVGTGLFNPKNKPGNLALYLGFDSNGGGASFFQQYRRSEIRRYAVAWVLNELADAPGQKIDTACEAAFEATMARFGPDAFGKRHKNADPAEIKASGCETIKKWYNKIAV